jgi:hypothetical protein
VPHGFTRLHRFLLEHEKSRHEWIGAARSVDTESKRAPAGALHSLVRRCPSATSSPSETQGCQIRNGGCTIANEKRTQMGAPCRISRACRFYSPDDPDCQDSQVTRGGRA